ncbi:sigma-70 family RNA polymerase sigma factor [Heyndrickxia oleronia]|uniref:sigma-70 family RNA polymerase sigma factor n=1 Tax=Heyndrickxia oleronia TaxID=38875 RepID=UPI0021B17C67|nr:sigma-70 family RNA polymerase sigma factor [Heyndrickxia oleronia]
MKTKLGNESGIDKTDITNFYPALKRYCRMMTRNNWDGDDLAQETMEKMLKTYIDKNASINITLLYRIAHNRWVDQMRKDSKVVNGSLQEPSYDPIKDLPELYSIIEKLVSNLSYQQTVIFILKDVFQFSLSDISESLNMTEGAIKASLFRTRNRLKNIVADNDPQRLLQSYMNMDERGSFASCNV